MGLLRRGRSKEVVVVRESTPPPTMVTRAPEPHTVPRPVRSVSDWSWRLLVTALAAGGLIFGLMQLSTVVVPVLVATLVASLLMPVANWLVRKGLPRALATVIAVVGAFGLIAGVLTLAGSSIADGVPELADNAIAGFEDVLTWLSTGPLGLDEATLTGWLDQIQEQISANAQAIAAGALSVTSSAGQVLAGALIMLFCLFFFILDGRTIWTWLVRLFPRDARSNVDGAGLRSWISLGSYARTQILVAFVDGVGIGLGAWILGVPLALPLGVLVFVGAFIPIVGALVTGSIAVLVALVDGGVVTALIMLAIVLGVQQVEGNLLQPLLMSRALKLHPVAVLLAVSTGTLVGGIVGALIAVPIVAVANTAIKYLNGNDPVPESLQAELDELTSQWQRT